MSVLIKGMEMPDSCEKCPFLDYEQGFCFASGEKEKSGWYVSSLYSGSPEFNTMRNPKCPLVEVPTPHGRLIDADALMDYLTIIPIDLAEDVVKVVRCRDCKYFDTHYIACKSWKNVTQASAYCWYGERREIDE